MSTNTSLLLLVKQFKDSAVNERQFYAQLTELITAEIGCSRASLWLYKDMLLDEIIAIDLYDAPSGQHYSDIHLHEDDFAPYFEAMRNDGGIDAADAMAHPATLCFNESYFEPNDIVSLLDVGIRYNGQLVGVFCCENVSTIMNWNDDQKAYLEQAGKLITFAIKPVLQQRFAALF
ncbi:GAF domain-containing protein [Alishewanella longhuensis]